MNEIFWLILVLGILNFATLIANFVLIRKFEDFKEITSLHKQIYDLDQKLYKSILAEIKGLEDIYADHKNIMDHIANHYDQITDQYKTISELQDEYRKLCKECVDRYGDAYEQFKLCNDKLNEICTPNGLLKDDFFYENAPAGDSLNGGIL